MRRARRAAAAAASAVLLFAAGVYAADDANPQDCRPDGNQLQLNACAVRDYRAADAALNIRYGEVMKSLSAPVRTALRTEQRAWLKGRDPGCKTASKGSEGGSIWALEFYTCLEQSTRQRTAELDLWKGRTQ